MDKSNVIIFKIPYTFCSHSFGYDCYSKEYNICAADDNTVMYAAGNYITMFNIKSERFSFRKCAGDGGVGHIVVSLFEQFFLCTHLNLNVSLVISLKIY